MRLTLKRKISFGIVGVAFLALVVDRLTSSDGPEPRPAAAHATPAAALTQAAKPVHTDAGFIELSAISTRLQALAASEKLDPATSEDAFHSGGNWLSAPKAQVDPSAEAAAAIAHFRQQHKLLAVLKSGRGAMALVDGRTFRRGQTIDGFKIVEVRDRSVVFDSVSGKVELFVAGAEPATAEAPDQLLITPSRGNRDGQDQ